jgi:hypothetical protein
VYRPRTPFVDELVRRGWVSLRGAPTQIADSQTQIKDLRLRNPGALVLIEGAREKVPRKGRSPLDNRGLMRTVVSAMNSLEENGYVAPYVCVFGRRPFVAAHGPVGTSIAYTRDRLEPLVGRELLHAAPINLLPRRLKNFEPSPEEWESRGVLVSLSGDAVDLAIAVESHARVQTGE